MTAFSRLQRASWDGIEFPVRHYTVKGSLRYHVHEYPHAPGGAFENLRRKLYEVRMSVPMLARLRNYPDLFPTRWALMRQQFETGEPRNLVVPTIGTIKCRCIEWPETMDAKIQSGVMVELAFLEDQSQEYLVEKLIQVDKQRIPQLIEFLDGEWSKAVDKYKDGVSAYELGLFDAIISTARDILSIKDNIEYYGAMVEAKIEAFEAVVSEADRAIRMFDDPGNWAVVNAVRDLWAAVEKFKDDLLGKGYKLETFIVPMTMSITDVSKRLYGNNSMAVTLMQSNDIDDPLAIPTGTRIRYYPDVMAA